MSNVSKYTSMLLAAALFMAAPANAQQGYVLPDNTAIQGHIKAYGSPGLAPPVGVGCTIAAQSTDTVGQCTASAASGSITFARPYGTSAAPTCVVWDQSATSTVSMPVYAVSNTAITLTTIINTHVLGWICIGQQSSS